MSKGSAFTRTVQYFRTADLVEAEACLQAATEIVASRAPAEPVTRRKRRTKAELAAAKSQPHVEAQGATA